MDYMKDTNQLLEFIQSCPSMFHSIETTSKELLDNGYTYLKEGQAWKIEKGGKYFTTRNHSSIIAFQVGSLLDDYHFQLCASHSDSPTYKVKEVAEIEGKGGYIKLNVEGYGGMIDSSWYDRPLGLAGRVFVKENNSIKSHLIHIDKDILLIPNVAIHMNREINDGFKYNRAIDLCPLFSTGDLSEGAYKSMIAKEVGCDVNQILGTDLYLVNHQKPSIWGYNQEFVSTPKLDDLQCLFVSLQAFLQSKNEHGINVLACFDNEEVGSLSKQGAASTFLKDTLYRINEALDKNFDEYCQAISKSFMVSCDNAHSVHPNHPELTDAQNCTYMNGGIVIKEAANQKYTTNGFSRAVFKNICEQAGVPVQSFANRSDKVGGSTLGNLSNAQVSLHCVDIGLAQLAMHSSFETGGAMDTSYAIKALRSFYNTNIIIDETEEVYWNEL